MDTNTECEEELNPNSENKNQDEKTVRYGGRSALSQIIATSTINFILFTSGISYKLPAVLIGSLDHHTASNETLQETPFLIMTDEQSSWLGSIVFMGRPIGALVGGYLSQFIGAKSFLLISNVPFACTYILMYYARATIVIIISAFLLGFLSGVASGPTLSYIAEISEPRVRGTLSSLRLLISNMGGLFVYFLYAATSDWRLTVFVSALIPITNFFIAFFIPESPTWLLSKGNIKEAEKSLRWLRGWSKKSKVNIELNKMIRDNEEIQSHESGIPNSRENIGMISIFRNPGFIRPYKLLMTLFLMVYLSAMGPILPFLIQFFKHFDSPIPLSWVLVISGFITLLSSLVNSLTMHMFGKRNIALWSSAINTIFIFFLSACTMNVHWNGWIPLVSFSIVHFVSNYGLISVPWVMIPEVYSQSIRGVACGITVATIAFITFVNNKIYLYFYRYLGVQGTMLLYSIVSLANFFYIYFYLPETEGRSLKDICQFFSENQSVATFHKNHKKSQSFQSKEGV